MCAIGKKRIKNHVKDSARFGKVMGAITGYDGLLK